VPAAVYAASVSGLAQSGVQLGDRCVERAVEVRRACFGADDRPAGDTGDLHTLAVVGLARVAFVEQLDVDADQLLVVPLHLRQLVGDMYAVMIGHLDIAALHDDVHA
jgi:hypothetical protein